MAAKEYWDMFNFMKYSEHYYQLYALRCKTISRIISAVCLLASSAFLATLCVSGRFRALWGVLALACQLISLLQPVFPYGKRLIAANYINQGIRTLLLDVERSWTEIRYYGKTDEEIVPLLAEYRNRYNAVESAYADADTFPYRKRIQDRAQALSDLYFENCTGCPGDNSK